MKTITVPLSYRQINYLREILNAEIKTKKDRMLHAASRNTDFFDPDADTAVSTLGVLDLAIDGSFD